MSVEFDGGKAYYVCATMTRNGPQLPYLCLCMQPLATLLHASHARCCCLCKHPVPIAGYFSKAAQSLDSCAQGCCWLKPHCLVLCKQRFSAPSHKPCHAPSPRPS